MTDDSTEAGKAGQAAEPLALRLNDGLGVRREMPRYVHDCDRCVFLGGVQRDLFADLYHCMQGGSAPTVVARFSDEDHDYVSGIKLACMCAYLGEAVKRAKELCLPVGA